MTKLAIENLRAQLHEALLLDLDDYGLDENHGELTSKFIGLQLNSAFQPIYDAEAGDFYGHEALLRPSLGGIQPATPKFVFSFAEESGKLVKFDRVCRTLHVLNYLQIADKNRPLFLNVHPKLLVSVNAHGKVFERILHAHSVPTQQVVIEIQESAVEQEKHLSEAIENYKDRGYRIAIDDFGRKHSNLERLWRLEPEFVKLDLSIIQEVEHNPRVKRILPGLIKIIRDLGAQPVIEGIETQVQLDLAIESGATLLQGYFLGKPASIRHWLQSPFQAPGIKAAA